MNGPFFKREWPWGEEKAYARWGVCIGDPDGDWRMIHFFNKDEPVIQEYIDSYNEAVAGWIERQRI